MVAHWHDVKCLTCREAVPEDPAFVFEADDGTPLGYYRDECGEIAELRQAVAALEPHQRLAWHPLLKTVRIYDACHGGERDLTYPAFIAWAQHLLRRRAHKAKASGVDKGHLAEMPG